MRKAATEHENVFREPASLLSFDAFGDNALPLTLRAYVGAIKRRIRTSTELHPAIKCKFEEAGITIALPQHDIHLDTSKPLEIRMQAASRPARDSVGQRADDELKAI